MPKRKSPLEPRTRRKRAYEIIEGMPIQYPQDPLRELENQTLRDLSTEYRVMRIEEMIAKKKKQLDKVDAPGSDISMQKQNLEMIKTMMEIAKMNQPKEGKDNTLEYVKMFKDLMLESAKLRGGGGQSFFESMLTDQNLFARTQDLFRRGEGEANQFSLEIEKVRGERMMQNKKFDLEIQRERLQREMDMQKLNMVLGTLNPIMSLGAQKLEQGVKQRGMDFGRPQNPGNPNPTGEMSEVRIQCNCGFDSPMFFAGDPPSQVSCPGCGAVLSIGVEGSSEEGSQDWPQKSQNF